MRTSSIEEEAGVRLIVRLNLKLSGFGVLETADGAAGLELARAEEPDLPILLDAMRPGLRGSGRLPLQCALERAACEWPKDAVGSESGDGLEAAESVFCSRAVLTVDAALVVAKPSQRPLERDHARTTRTNLQRRCRWA